jgi:hypothetical protein
MPSDLEHPGRSVAAQEMSAVELPVAGIAPEHRAQGDSVLIGELARQSCREPGVEAQRQHMPTLHGICDVRSAAAVTAYQGRLVAKTVTSTVSADHVEPRPLGELKQAPGRAVGAAAKVLKLDSRWAVRHR